MVADEVMAGFGRTGKWFAIDHWGVTPDLMTMAKGLTSSYLPLGAVAMTHRIADKFDGTYYSGGLTYSSHPVSLAAALATIGVYEEDGLIENAPASVRSCATTIDTWRRRIRVSARRATWACSGSSTSSAAVIRGRRSPRSTGRRTR